MLDVRSPFCIGCSGKSFNMPSQYSTRSLRSPIKARRYPSDRSVEAFDSQQTQNDCYKSAKSECQEVTVQKIFRRLLKSAKKQINRGVVQAIAPAHSPHHPRISSLEP